MAKQIKTVSDLIPDAANANKGTERGRYAVEASLRETGAGRSIVVDREGRIIAGNKTLEAWADISGEIEIVKTDGKKLIVVQREDLDLSDVEGLARKLAYYDNRAGQLGLEFDAEQVLADIQAGVDLSIMFFDNEIADILAELEVPELSEPQSNDRALGEKSKQIKPVLYADEIADFELAIRATGQKNRGQALLEVCRYYLENNAKGQLYATLESAVEA